MGKEIKFLKETGLIPRRKQRMEMYFVGQISVIALLILLGYGII